MKLIKLLIIVLSLSIPIQSYACWDDDWDDNYDPWDDEDDPWGDDDNDWSAWDDFLNSLYGDDWNYDGNNSNDDDIYKEIDLPDGWECVGERPEPEYPIIDISDYWDRYFDSDDSNSDGNGFNDDSDDSAMWGDQSNEKEPQIPYKRYLEPKKGEHYLNEEDKKMPGSWYKQDKKNELCANCA